MSEELRDRARAVGIGLVLAASGVAVFWLLARAQPIVTVEQGVPSITRVSTLHTNTVTSRCLACNGRGQTPAGPCTVCNGKGFLAAAGVYSRTSEARETRTTVTVQADLSLWERTLAAIGLGPDLNSKPQRALNGSVPLVEQYLALAKPDGPDYEIVQWHPVEASGRGWIQKVTCQVRQAGAPRQVTRAVFILDRRVIRSAIAGAGL